MVSLTIENNLQLQDPALHTIVFVVRDNVIVNTGVTRVDGIYVAGGTFTSATVGSEFGNQLVINGAVYAQTLSLNRKLSISGATCGGNPCTNLTEPAEKVIYDPKYLVALNTLIASPQVSWREIAP